MTSRWSRSTTSIACGTWISLFLIDSESNLREAIQKLGLKDDIEFAEKLLVDGLVASVPGTPFEIPGFVRASYACSMEDIDKAVQRLREFVSR